MSLEKVARTHSSATLRTTRDASVWILKNFTSKQKTALSSLSGMSTIQPSSIRSRLNNEISDLLIHFQNTVMNGFESNAKMAIDGIQCF